EVDVVLEVGPTSVDIQSYLDKSSVVELAVHAAIGALHEAQVGVPEEAVIGLAALVADAVALHAHAAVDAVEVGDLVRLIADERTDAWVGVGWALEVLVDVEPRRVEGAGGQRQGHRDGSRRGASQGNERRAEAPGEDGAVLQRFEEQLAPCRPAAARVSC